MAPLRHAGRRNADLAYWQSIGEPTIGICASVGCWPSRAVPKFSDTLSEFRVIMMRREVILMFAGAAASYPLMAWAQQPLQIRLIYAIAL